MKVPVKTLLGQAYEVEVPEGSTVADLARRVADGGACRLFLSGAELQPSSLGLAEALAPLRRSGGGHVVVLPVAARAPRGRRRGGGTADPGAAGRGEPAAGPATAPGPSRQRPPLGEPTSPLPAARVRAGGGGGSPLDTLLPGFASRPNPSPQRGRGARMGARRGDGGTSDGPGVAALLAAAEGDCGGAPIWVPGGDLTWAPADGETGAAGAVGGCGFLADPADAAPPGGPGTERGPSTGDPAAVALGLAPTRRAHQGRTLLQQHLLAVSEEAAARERLKQQQQQEQQQETQQQQQAQQKQEQHQEQQQQQEPQQHPPQPGEEPSRDLPTQGPLVASGGGRQQPRAGRHPGAGRQTAAAAQLWSDLAQELRSAPAARSEPEQRDEEPVAVQQEVVSVGRRKRTAPKQPRPTAAARAAPEQHSGPGQGDPLALRLHRGELSLAEARALDALPLPPNLLRLLRIFEVVAAWQGFLTRQHMASTWDNSAAHVCGLLPRDNAGPCDVLLMAELAPHCVALLEVARELRTALDSTHPVVPPIGSGGAQQTGGATAEMPSDSLDSAVLLFEITDPGSAGTGTRHRSSSTSSTRSKLRLGRGLVQQPAGGPVSSGGPAGRGSAATRRQKRARDGEEATVQQVPDEQGAKGNEGEEGQQQQQGVQDGGAGEGSGALQEGPSVVEDEPAAVEAAPPVPRTQHVGKRVLARRKQAFRRALAFAVTLVHQRFMERLAADGCLQGTAANGAAGDAGGSGSGGSQPATANVEASAPSSAQRRSSRRAAADAQQRIQQQMAPAEDPAPPPNKRARRARGRGRQTSQPGGGDSTTNGGSTAAPSAAGGEEDVDSGWDPVVRGAWHPEFDVDAVSMGALRAVAAEHQRWLAARLRLDAPSALTGLGGHQLPAAPPRVVKRHERCTDTTQLDPRAFLDHLCALPWYDGQLAHHRELPGRAPTKAVPTAQLAPSVVAALASRGIVVAGPGGPNGAAAPGLFSHQAAAIDALLLHRRHTVVCTPTASGKSVCYNVPILQALADDAAACALYLFPTKALAQDQLAALRVMVSAAFGQQAASIVQTYDGDTPQDIRPTIRSSAQLLITNPDMLHQSILPFHSSFARLLANLKYVVVDEGHAYRGAFGSHTALVLRRLRRLCSRVHGSAPLFVVTSATVANPHGHVRSLLGLGESEALEVVDSDGSPAGPKLFALWNPPLTADAKVAQQAGAAAPTRTEGRAVARSTYRARRQQMRVELREANAARRRGVSIVRGMTEAEWQAAVRLASGKRLLTQCLFDFRYGGDRPQTLDLLPADGRGEGAGTAAGSAAADAAGPAVNRSVDGVPGPSSGAMATSAAASAPAVVSELLGLLAAAGVEVKEEPMEEGEGAATGSDPPQQQQEDQGQQSGDGVDQDSGSDEEAAAREALAHVADEVGCTADEGAVADNPATGLEPLPITASTGPAGAAAVAAAEEAAAAAGPERPPARSREAAAHRAALVAKAEAALSAVREVPGAPNPILSLTGAAEQRQQQRRILGEAATTAGANPLAQPLIPAGGGMSTAHLPAELRQAIERALPPRGVIFERHGAAGTATDQRRESPIVEISLLLAEAVQHGLRAIAFCKTRKLSEMVAKYTRDTLRLTAPALANSVRVYRGGYTPAERRALEAGLHSGELAAVAATNALELGIDVGALDLTLHLGFPGSVSSLWQQAGRAGRREQSSLSLVVAFDGPLDQHFVRHPDDLFGRPIEAVQVDPLNARLLRQHLACAAAELPLLVVEDGALFGGAQLAEAVGDLVAAGLLSRHARADGSGAVPGGAASAASTVGLCASLHYCGPGHSPAPRISLRTIDPERYVVHDITTGRVLEEIEANKAFFVIYDGAIYLHQGVSYYCTSLDLHQRVALVRPARVKHYTSVQDVMDVHVTGSRVAYPTPREALAAIEARRGVGSVKAETKQEPKEEPKEEEGEEGEGAGEDAKHGHDNGGLGSQPPSPGPLASTATCEGAVVTVRFLGYHRVAHGTGEILDSVELFLPDAQWETQASYIRLPPTARGLCSEAGVDYREAVHAAAHAVLNVLPLYMVCNATDVATECDNPYDTRYRPERLLLYDKHPGGIGLAAQATPLFPELLQRAIQLVTDCPCPYQRGCPACVQHLDCKNYNAVLNKRGALIILRAALEQERRHTQRQRQQQQQ